MRNITFVGLDVHKATIAVSVAEGGRDGEVRHLGRLENRPEWCGDWSNVCGGAAMSSGCVTRLARAVTGCTGNWPSSAVPAWWWRRP